MNDYRHNFETWHEWIAFCRLCDTVPGTGEWRRDDFRHSKQNDAEWKMGHEYRKLDKLAAYEKAFVLAEYGWPEGMARVRELAQPMVEQISHMVERHDPVYVDEPSGQIDVAKYLEGEPECWVAYNPTMVEGKSNKHITLVYNGCVSGGIGTDVMIAKGATVAALVDILELAGIRVKVILALASRGQIAFDFTVTVKEFDQPLDSDRIAYALAHPSSLRVLGFAAAETAPKKVRDAIGVPGGYGAPCDSVLTGDITIGRSLYGAREWTDPDKARAWVIEQLKAQGVEVEADGGPA